MTYSSRDEDETIALRVMGWILGDKRRAERMVALTGLTPEALRARIGHPATLKAMLDFVADHEPDLLACADDLGLAPARIVAARAGLGGGDRA